MAEKLIGGGSSKPSEVRCVNGLGCAIFDIIGEFCPDDLIPDTPTCRDAIKKAIEDKKRKATIDRNNKIAAAK